MKKTALGISEENTIVAAYLLGWISGLVLLLIEKENETIRYHAAQSLLVFGGLTLFSIVMPVFLFTSFAVILLGLINVVIFGLWILFIATSLKRAPIKLEFLDDVNLKIERLVKV